MPGLARAAGRSRDAGTAPLAITHHDQEVSLLLGSGDDAGETEVPMSEAVLPRLTTDNAIAQLPSDPKDLLTPTEHQALKDDLARLARLRRDAETASASLRLA